MFFQITKRKNRQGARARIWAKNENLENFGQTGGDAHLEFIVNGERYFMLLDRDSFKKWATHVLPDLFPK